MKLLEEQGLEAVMARAEMADEEPPPVNAPEEKRPSLSLEELEAKQGNIIKYSKENIKNMYVKYIEMLSELPRVQRDTFTMPFLLNFKIIKIDASYWNR